MQRLKMKLRMIINAIMDARVHCAGMTQEQAMALMTGRGHQEEGEATAKWRRVLLTSAQLSTYYVGFTEVSGLAAGLRSAHSEWPERRLHDAVLGHGSPPVRHLRTLVTRHRRTAEGISPRSRCPSSRTSPRIATGDRRPRGTSE